MASTGAKLPSTGTSVARSTGTAWTNPGNITVNDNTVASCSSGAAGSAYLRASNFAFGIPANSLIRGFTVVVEMAESSAGTETVSVQIVGAAGTAIGTAKTFVASGTALTVYTTGSGTDVWGTTGLTATDLNDTDFGIYVWYTTSHNTTVDFVSINVTYEPPISGSLAATETGTDTASINGKVNVRGNLAATETGTDTAAFAGTVSNAAITGSFAATETGSDTASFAAKVVVSGSLAASESGVDSAQIAGKILVTGQLAATETGSDTAGFDGRVRISGTLATTEIGQDTASFSGESPNPVVPGGGGGFVAFSSRSALVKAAEQILGLMTLPIVRQNKKVKKVVQRLERVTEQTSTSTIESIVQDAVAELEAQKRLSQYMVEIKELRGIIDYLKSIKAQEEEDEESLLLSL